MYKYKYVEAVGITLFKPLDHRVLIDKHAKDGWRFVSAIETESNGHGVPKRYDLVFEKKIDLEYTK